jgi:riboflavin transporter FmnP
VFIGEMQVSKKPTKSYLIASIAIMSALAIIFDIFSDVLPLRMPWGMKVDFVGTIWVLTYFLYGLSAASSVSVITTLFITMFMPTGFVGGLMKFVATTPMFLVPALVSRLPFFSKHGAKLFNKTLLIAGVAVLATTVRLLAAMVANYYWAIPIWTGIPTGEILAVMFGGSILEFIIFVAGLNVLQGIIDIVVAWLLAFKFKLSSMFGTW